MMGDTRHGVGMSQTGWDEFSPSGQPSFPRKDPEQLIEELSDLEWKRLKERKE
jgi:hypothetical protein